MPVRTILIIDDSPEDRTTFRRYLTRNLTDPYDIVEASMGAEALSLLERISPQCILLDFHLPDMDGMQIVKALKAANGSLPFPIVVMTGSGNTPLAIQFMKEGVQDYLSKGAVTQDSVLHAIENAIDKHKMHQQLEARRIELQNTNAALREANQSLGESETRFRLLADNAPVLIWTSNIRGRFEYMNRRWLEFIGISADAVGNYNLGEAIYPDDLDNALQVYRTAFESRTSFHMEFRLRNHSGDYRWMIATGAPRYSGENEFLGYIGSCLDITDQKVLQDQLFESQKLESLGRLAGGVAHDFNNLLTAILGYTELSLMTLPLEAEVRPFLQNVSAAGQRAANLTRQLLMYARRQMVEFTVVDVNQVILNMDPLLRRTIGEQYELVTILSNEPCHVHANASQIEQVLTNLVVNARDAMPTGGRILIETRVVTLDTNYAEQHVGVIPGPYVMYSVSDNGIGMTPEVRNRIFEPFYTTKELGKGTGLGLTTCYGIVKQSKGNIWVYSEPDKGTTFKVYLPRVGETSEEIPIHLPDNLPEGTETILLVDDEPMVRDIAARTLRAQGYRVLEASNGAEALHRQSEWPGEIDLLLSDVVMPLMGGKELAQRLLEIYPGMKVLYMSGYTQNVVLQQGVLKPGVLLLTKPFTSADLFLKVRDALGQRTGL